MKKPKNPPKLQHNAEKAEALLNYLNDPQISAFIKDINNRYLHWDEFVYRTPPNNADRELVWTLVKFSRSDSARELKISGEQGFSFEFNIPDILQQKLHEFDMNLGGSLGAAQIIPSEDKNRYLISSLMEEAIASSQLEGASTTRRVAKEMLKSNRKPKTPSEKMIFNNYATAKMIKNSRVKQLTPEFILEIHKSIVKDTLENKDFEGRFRESDDIHVIDNDSGEIVYTPPTYSKVPRFIEELCKFANNPGNYFIHPIVKAAIIHFLVGYIHPFVDGNGRTARSLFYWYLVKEGYWIVEFMSISRAIIKSPAKYGRAFLYTETDQNDLTYFLKYQIRTIEIALRELISYISRKVYEKKELFKIIEKFEGINERQALIIKEFYENASKTLTIKEFQEVYQVVYETARKDLLELEKKGFLKRRILGKKKLVFLRSDNLERMVEGHGRKV